MTTKVPDQAINKPLITPGELAEMMERGRRSSP